MKAAVFYGKEDLRIEEVPVPEIGENDVLIKVMACGICGTDLHIFDGDEGAAPTPPGTVLGHEFAGIVEKVSAGVSKFKPGDHVCIDPNQLCGHCRYCQEGIGHFCENMKGIGTSVHGGFAQYCSVNQSQVYKLPEDMPYTYGAMCEPLACCFHGMDLCEIKAGSSLLVIGAGMIGQLMLQLGKLKGAAKIAVLEPNPEKRKMVLKMGADIVLDPLTQPVAEKLKEAGFDNIETVIECVGRTGTIEQALEFAGNKAVVMLFGLTKPEDAVAVKPFQLFQKELTIKASYINPYTQGRALSLLVNNKIDVSELILPEENLESLPDILKDKKRFGMGKHVINPWLI